MDNWRETAHNGQVPSEFGKWLEQRFLKWQSDQGGRKTVTQFAKWLEVSRDIVNKWLNGTLRPGDKYIERLAGKLGPEIYDVLNRPRPDPNLQLIIRNWRYVPPEKQIEIAQEVARMAERGDAERNRPGMAKVKRR